MYALDFACVISARLELLPVKPWRWSDEVGADAGNLVHPCAMYAQCLHSNLALASSTGRNQRTGTTH